MVATSRQANRQFCKSSQVSKPPKTPAITQNSITLISMILFSDMRNPFQFGRELGIGSLVDRKKELAAVEQAIRDGNKLFLIGPRRYGKTSILRSATDRLKSNSAIVVRLDAESFPTIDLLV